MIALCDISLQCSVPGHAIFRMLEAIANGSFVVNKPEDFYDYIFSKKTIFLNKEMSIREALKYASKLAKDHLLSYVKIDILEKEYQEWIDYTIQAGVLLRTRLSYFFLDMARSKRNKENLVLQNIAKFIGSPQMTNELGKRFQLATDRPICRFEYLEAVREIEHLFEWGERRCSLKPWCMMSPDGAPVDDRCDNAPWKRCNDEQLCPYGLLWKHWKLSGYEVI